MFGSLILFTTFATDKRNNNIQLKKNNMENILTNVPAKVIEELKAALDNVCYYNDCVSYSELFSNGKNGANELALLKILADAQYIINCKNAIK